jgi:hypothetical protein
MQTIFVTTAGGTTQPEAKIDPFFYDALVPAVSGISPTSGPTTGAPPSPSPAPASPALARSTSVSLRPPASSWSPTARSPLSRHPTVPGRATFSWTRQEGRTLRCRGADQFAYKGAVPTVIAIAPISGPIAGGTTVTITGTGFTGATKVTFGPAAAITFTLVSDTEITAISPAQAASTRNIGVTAGGSASIAVVGDQFTYKK